MKREELLAKGYTEEQATEILNFTHDTAKTLTKVQKELEDIKTQNATYVNENSQMKAQLDEINKANMTEQEKLAEKQKEVEKNLAESRLIKSQAQAEKILSSLGLENEELEKLVASISSDDLEKTTANANLLVQSFENMRETTMKKTKEDLINKSAKPDIKDKDNEDNSMTKSKFDKLTYEEQKAFKDNNPEEYANLK